MARKKQPQGGNDEEMHRAMVMVQAELMGITPEEYAEFYNSVGDEVGPMADGVIESPIKSVGPGAPASSPTPPAMEDAEHKTLTLKVQMQDVTKPPMWRELMVPADFDFLQLHHAIQAACGFEDCHLWQFQRQAYNPDLQIGVPAESDEMGLEEWTHDARVTPITAFLAAKGDKLVYVYDFGDDWTFDVVVKSVGPRDGEVSVCTKWKSDLQPVEDTGGVWAYLNMRDVWAHRDSLTARQKKDCAEQLGFENFRELLGLLNDAQFDVQSVNERLATI